MLRILVVDVDTTVRGAIKGHPLEHNGHEVIFQAAGLAARADALDALVHNRAGFCART